MPLLVLIVWLFAEAWVIGAVVDRLGGLAVLLLLLCIAVMGVRLIQRQGYRTLLAVQGAMQRNELPALAMLDSLIVFLAGMLFVVPGFLSDAIALVLLFSGLRRHLARQAEAFIARRHPEFGESTIIEGEYYEVKEHRTLENDDQPRSGEDR